MKFNEFSPKPPTPAQGRVNALQANKERAADALAKEKQRQKVTKAQEMLRTANAPESSQPMKMPKSTPI